MKWTVYHEYYDVVDTYSLKWGTSMQSATNILETHIAKLLPAKCEYHQIWAIDGSPVHHQGGHTVNAVMFPEHLFTSAINMVWDE